MLETQSGSLTNTEQGDLLRVAMASIEHRLLTGRALTVRPADFTQRLRRPQATFVTLKIGGELRGCIGDLIAQRPLVVDIAHNAFAAAFRDPRFCAVTRSEFEKIDVEISILSPSEEMEFGSESELLRNIQPGTDGLILRCGSHGGTLLPSVWSNVPKPAEFLRHLKLKAGLPADFWSPEVQIDRYFTQSFSSKRILAKRQRGTAGES